MVNPLVVMLPTVAEVTVVDEAIVAVTMGAWLKRPEGNVTDALPVNDAMVFAAITYGIPVDPGTGRAANAVSKPTICD
jgi:carbon starvation protein CstA